jgi:hypothetical protein
VLYADDPYSTDIFFQSMEQSKGADGIQNWIQNQISQLADQGAKRMRLCGVTGFANNFHLFTQQFSLGKARNSSWTDLVPIDNPVMLHPVTLTSGIPLADSTVGITTVYGSSFTVRVFTFSVNRGQTDTISYFSSLPNVLMSYMQDGDTL